MEQHLYFAACDPTGGIYHYTLADGALRFCEKTALDRPMYLAIEGDRLYALMRGPRGGSDMHSALISYPIDAQGALGAPTEPALTGGECACHLHVKNGTVYAVNYVSGNVIRMPDTLVAHHGHGPHLTRQDGPHTHFVNRTPDGKYLFVVDLGNDTIYTYDFDLNPVATTQVPAGAGCRHLAYSTDGTRVFCANELGGSVSVFAYVDGRLALRGTYPALPASFSGTNTTAAIHVHGEYLYVSNRGHDSIVRYRIDDDRLTDPVWTSCGGQSPRDFDIFGDMLFCTNETSSNVTVFRLDAQGCLVQLPIELPMPHPLCVIVR